MSSLINGSIKGSLFQRCFNPVPEETKRDRLTQDPRAHEPHGLLGRHVGQSAGDDELTNAARLEDRAAEGVWVGHELKAVLSRFALDDADSASEHRKGRNKLAPGDARGLVARLGYPRYAAFPGGQRQHRQHLPAPSAIPGITQHHLVILRTVVPGREREGLREYRGVVARTRNLDPPSRGEL